MKQKLYNTGFVILLLFTTLTSCQTPSGENSSIISDFPDNTWRDVYFSETHDLSTLNPCALYDVTVTKILDGTYSKTVSEKCLLLECKIKHIFFSTPSVTPIDNLTMQDDSILVWIEIDGYDSNTISQLVSLFESIDSAIIYGYQINPRIVKNSFLCKQLEDALDEQEFNYFEFDGLSFLKLPPCLMIHNLEEWPIIPISQGKFSAESISSILGVNNMAFSFDSENPDGLQYFKDGDEIDVIYDALNKFVSEF